MGLCGVGTDKCQDVDLARALLIMAGEEHGPCVTLVMPLRKPKSGYSEDILKLKD